MALRVEKEKFVFTTRKSFSIFTFAKTVSKKITQFEFRLSHQSLVRKMTGNIEAEYQILDPPLGKGSYSLTSEPLNLN
jgi:hypothetical protein